MLQGSRRDPGALGLDNFILETAIALRQGVATIKIAGLHFEQSTSRGIWLVLKQYQSERVFMRPSVALDMKRSAVREVVGRFRTANPRIFGSVLHGTDQDGSDLDLLVDALPGATLIDLGGLQDELASLLGVDVDVRTPGDLPLKFRAKVLAEAKPV